MNKNLTLLGLLVLCGQAALGYGDDSTYLLRTRDVIDISVLGQPDLSRELTVLDDGTISFPDVGVLAVKGERLDAVRDQIAAGLRKYYVKPQVTVSVAKMRPITATGAGVFMTPNTVDLKPTSRLLDLFAQCGGLQLGLKPEWVRGTLIRDGKSSDVNLSSLLSGTDPSANVALEDRDIFVVQETDRELRNVKVVGEVQKSGSFAVTGPTTLASALAEAGGITVHAAMKTALWEHDGVTKTVDLSRLLLDGTTNPASIMLSPGDTLTIPTNQVKFSVLGALNAPGQFDFPETHPLSLLQAIALAGGETKDANMKKVQVLRAGKLLGKPELVNAQDSLTKGGANAVMIEPNDIVFVPNQKEPLGIRDTFPIIGPLLYWLRPF